MRLTKLNKNRFYRKTFERFDDVVYVNADYKHNSVIYRRYMESVYESVNVNDL